MEMVYSVMVMAREYMETFCGEAECFSLLEEMKMVAAKVNPTMTGRMKVGSGTVKL